LETFPAFPATSQRSLVFSGTCVHTSLSSTAILFSSSP
jgi:hypothetical protein